MAAEVGSPRPGWNPLDDVSAVLEYHFMVNAMLAGTIVAVIAGLAGWMMVLRREAFAGHTLSVMAFPGASAAALLGIPASWGYFGFCALGAVAIGRGGPGARGSGERAAGIAIVQVAALASGFLFLSLYGGILGDLEGQLFGTFLGISDGRLLTLLAVAVAVMLALGALARPLLFASVDPEVAAARGVPVQRLSSAFLLLLGLAVAATSQITGALLVFSLLVGPAASAQAITPRPALSLLLTVLLGLLTVWLGLGISYFSTYPAGFFIATVSFVLYLLARLVGFATGGPRHLHTEELAPVPSGVIA
jgi:zinc/manganese transport system permease protein